MTKVEKMKKIEEIRTKDTIAFEYRCVRDGYTCVHYGDQYVDNVLQFIDLASKKYGYRKVVNIIKWVNTMDNMARVREYEATHKDYICKCKTSLLSKKGDTLECTFIVVPKDYTPFKHGKYNPPLIKREETIFNIDTKLKTDINSFLDSLTTRLSEAMDYGHYV